MALPARWVLRRLLHMCSKRYFAKKSSTHKLRSKQRPKNLALQHFDNFYGPVFGKTWPSMRLGLLCTHKSCAIINPYSDAEKSTNILMDLGAEDVRLLYEYRLAAQLQGKGREEEDVVSSAQEVSSWVGERNILPLDGTETTDNSGRLFSPSSGIYSVGEGEYVPATKMIYQEQDITDAEYFSFYNPEEEVSDISMESEDPIVYPEYLKVFVFPRGDVSRFPEPCLDPAGLYGYYLMDGASLLPVLALDVQPEDIIGDLCAAPGGKSLAILFTLYPEKLICNDLSESRLKRLKQVLQSYVPSFEMNRNRILVTKQDASLADFGCIYDKVLVDVPCTNDRHSLLEDDNNYFSPSRLKERTQLPEKQCDILRSGLKMLKPGGSLVYSTCSLSPIQNDGVVHMALQRMCTETNFKLAVKNLTDAFRPFQGIFAFSKSWRYGQLVIPFLPLNYGPMYISKITRLD